MSLVHINLYTTKSEKTALDKTMEGGSKVELTGTFRDASNVINPSVEIQADAGTIAGKNYFEITEFGRKYFITEVTATGNNRCVVTGHVDVLSTYASEIRANSGVVGRSENRWNLYLDDNMIKVSSIPKILTKNGFSGASFSDNPSIVMVVVG